MGAPNLRAVHLLFAYPSSHKQCEHSPTHCEGRDTHRAPHVVGSIAQHCWGSSPGPHLTAAASFSYFLLLFFLSSFFFFLSFLSPPLVCFLFPHFCLFFFFLSFPPSQSPPVAQTQPPVPPTLAPVSPPGPTTHLPPAAVPGTASSRGRGRPGGRHVCRGTPSARPSLPLKATRVRQQRSACR